MKIGPVIPEITRVTKMHLFYETANIGIYVSHWISQQLLDWSYQRFSIGSRMHGDYRADISCAVVQGSLLYGNQLGLVLGAFADVKIDRHHSWLWHSEKECNIVLFMHSLIAPLIPLYRVNRWWKSGPIVYELKWGRKWKLCATRPKFDNRRLFGTLALLNGLE